MRALLLAVDLVHRFVTCHTRTFSLSRVLLAPWPKIAFPVRSQASKCKPSAHHLSLKTFMFCWKKLGYRPIGVLSAPKSRLKITCSQSQSERTATLRRVLDRPGLLLCPAAYDGISARLTEEAGFEVAFMSGFSVSGARLAKPDTGLLSYAEMVDQGRCMHEATRSIPIIGDADTGYGNAMNVKRTVQGYASAGFAGLLIEDQVWPKSCGHVRGKRVIPRDEAVSRIRAACDARNAGSDIIIVARTDARQAESFSEALWRAAAFVDAGADVVFVDALTSVAEMRTLCADVQGAYKMANMLEGGGKTPILSPDELEDLGFKLCAYPLSLLGVSIKAMRGALRGLKEGNVPVPPMLPTFDEVQAALGFPEYFEEESKYAVPEQQSIKSNQSSTLAGFTNDQDDGVRSNKSLSEQKLQSGQSVGVPVPPPISNTTSTSTPIEADEVIEPGDSRKKFPSRSTYRDDGNNMGGGGGDSVDNSVDLTRSSIDNDSYRRGNESGSGGTAQWLRIKISDIATGSVKLDTRFPAGFLGRIAAIVPQVAGLDLEALLRGGVAQQEQQQRGGPAFSFDADSDRIDVYIEY